MSGALHLTSKITTQPKAPRDLLAQFASAALAQGQISPQDYEHWNRTLEDLAASGDFFYGMVYHLIAAEAAR